MTGSQEFQDKTGLHGFIYADPVGAILIGLYIIFNWWKTGSGKHCFYGSLITLHNPAMITVTLWIVFFAEIGRYR